MSNLDIDVYLTHSHKIFAEIWTFQFEVELLEEAKTGDSAIISNVTRETLTKY